MGISACFAQRKDVFPGSGTQNGRIWGTEVCFFGSGTPKRPVLGYGGEDFRAREPKKACFGVRRGEAEAGAKRGGERDNSRNEKGWAEIVSQRIRKFGPEQNGESKAGRPIGQSKRAAAGKAAKNKSKPRNRLFWKANKRV